MSWGGGGEQNKIKVEGWRSDVSLSGIKEEEASYRGYKEE